MYPYPCIRAFHFVNLMMSRNDIYSTVVEAGKTGDTLFLDLGCCSGLSHFLFNSYTRDLLTFN